MMESLFCLSKYQNTVEYAPDWAKALAGHILWGMKFEARKMGEAFTVDVEKKGMQLQDASDALERTGKEEQMVGVNGREEGVKVNARVHQVKHVKPFNKRKKSKIIIKMKLAKNVGGEGSSLATVMELD
ncbi:unnamed protein product [Lactuca virosa]|uniref:Uncharacterized protein n=1 Tax=Lactuca virosa TaxID=75947 RepID=A0AAU9P139_9ASTR|nr:unnamed protein product [Lactuca virosa]